MLKNFVNIFLRSVRRNKVYTLINVLGLTLGITSCILVFLTVKYELSFDTMHDKASSIYRIVREETNSAGIEKEPNIPYPLAGAIREGLEDLPLTTGIHYSPEEQVQVGNRKSHVEHVLFADSMFLEVFDFETIQGNAKETLSEPNKALITEGLGIKLFNGESPIGKSLKLGGVIDLQIEGVLKDAPDNSHLQYQLIVSYPSFTSDFSAGFEIDSWGINMSGYCYTVLPPLGSSESYEMKLNSYLEKFIQSDDGQEKLVFKLQKLNDIHFDEQYVSEEFASIDENEMLVLISIGIFIMLVACINFINLSTAQAVKKSKEIGVRKVLGAGKSQVVAKFMSETFALCLFSLIISLGLVERLIPEYNSFFGKHISLNILGSWENLVAITTLLVGVTILSGLYPSLLLANYQPAKVLKSKVLQPAKSSISLRQGLVTFQFIISQVLIVGTIVVSSQLQYFQEQPLGFEKDAIITLPIFERDSSLLVNLKSRLLTNKNIENVSFGVGVPTSDNNFSTSFRYVGDQGVVEADINLKLADYDYLETFGLEIVAGRWITKEDRLSTEQELIINEAMTRAMGFNNPEDAIGHKIEISINQLNIPVTGVIKDFHLRSLHEEIEPIAIIDLPVLFFEAGIKISDNNIAEALTFIEKQWALSFPEKIFEYEFLDKSIEALYLEERRTLSLFQMFSGISIFIGCLGLFGLISFIVLQRSKEVGVRKVLGATISQITFSLSKEFIVLVFVAFLIAAPLSWYFMNSWLSNFAYKMDISIWVFLSAFIITIFIALSTVGYRAIKAAMVNPVDVLRDE